MKGAQPLDQLLAGRHARDAEFLAVDGMNFDLVALAQIKAAERPSGAGARRDCFPILQRV